MLRVNSGLGAPPTGPLRIAARLCLVALTVASLAVSPANGEPKSSAVSFERAIVQCSERESNFQRLECYDGVVERLIQNSPRANAPTLRQQMVDSDEVQAKKAQAERKPATVTVQSRREVRLKGGKVVRPEVRVECGGAFSLRVDAGIKLPVGKVAVNTRLDKEEVVKELWSVAPDRLGVVAPNGKALEARLRGAKILEVKVAPRKGEPIPFSVELESVHGACGELR